MIYAIDSDGKKIKASPNASATCANCKSEVVAKCGKLNIWHWAHKNLMDCDSWQYEPMSEWHVKWQSYFGEAQREVFITKSGECHIADIMTAKGLVIEIQNSAISPDEIFEREIFYGQMIWVVNTAEFKHNLYFKEYPPVPYQGIWSQYIKKTAPSGAIGYWIKVPDDDLSMQILAAVKKSDYTMMYEDEDEEEEYWFKSKRSIKEELEPALVNAFEGYLIDCKLRQTIEENKTYDTNFRWTHLRKIWRTATKPVFLDLNNGFLFYIKTLYENGNGFGKIVPKRIFLKKYSS